MNATIIYTSSSNHTLELACGVLSVILGLALRREFERASRDSDSEDPAASIVTGSYMGLGRRIFSYIALVLGAIAIFLAYRQPTRIVLRGDVLEVGYFWPRPAASVPLRSVRRIVVSKLFSPESVSRSPTGVGTTRTPARTSFALKLRTDTGDVPVLLGSDPALVLGAAEALERATGLTVERL